MIETDVWNLTRYAKMCVDAGKHIHMDKPASGILEEYKALRNLTYHIAAFVQPRVERPSP